MPHECRYNWTHTFTGGLGGGQRNGTVQWLPACCWPLVAFWCHYSSFLWSRKRRRRRRWWWTQLTVSPWSQKAAQYSILLMRGDAFRGIKKMFLPLILAAVPLPQCSPSPCCCVFPPLASFVWRLHKHPLYLAHLPPSLSLALCIARLWVFPLTLSCLALFSSSTCFTTAVPPLIYIFSGFVSLPLCLHLLLSSPRLIFFSKAIYLHLSPLPPLVNLSLSLLFAHLTHICMDHLFFQASTATFPLLSAVLRVSSQSVRF